MALAREVVISGIGVVSPIGTGRSHYWDALRAQRSGVRPLPSLAATEWPVKFGGDLADFDARAHVAQRKTLKVMSREVQTGFSAAEMALADAQWRAGGVPADRFGVVFANELLYSALDELEGVYRRCVVNGEFRGELYGQHIMADLYPLWMLKYLPNGVACHVGITHDARGPSNSIVVGDASSLLALQEATLVIERGHADLMVAGGSGTRINISAAVFRGDLLLSHRHEAPAAACRPFERQRDGIVNGEGAAAVVLETAASAKSRGATPLARVLGFHSGFGKRGTSDYGLAIANSIRGALRSAGLSPQDIGHVNAHGLSTIDEDRAEAAAIRATLGDVPVTALKSYFGNLGAGGGLVELAASVLSFAHGEVPVTLNYEQADPECPINVIHGQPLRGSRPTALVLSQSLAGQVAAVVIAAP